MKRAFILLMLIAFALIRCFGLEPMQSVVTQVELKTGYTEQRATEATQEKEIQESEPIPEPVLSIYDTGEDFETQREILAIIIYQEQGGDASSDDARMAVGQVFVNRIMDKRFPSTFTDVALQHGQWGSLYRTGIKWPTRAQKEVEAHAVERAYKCAERILSGERMIPENVVWAAEFAQGKGIYAFIDGMYFCW